MPAPGNQERIRLRKRIAAADVRITAIAEAIGHDTSVVSKAINHRCFPRVRAKIVKHLQEVSNA